MKNRGFTLVELLVAFSLFVLILGGVLTGVQTAVKAQRDMLEKQAAIEELSLAMDYVSRAFRGAKKDLIGSCIPGGGWTFQVTNRIRWLDRNEQCRELFQDSGHDLFERISNDNTANFGAPRRIIADDFDVDVIWFRVHGEYQGDAGNPDHVQPHITLAVLVRSDKPGNRPLASMQTTITTRTIDVQQ